MSLTLPAPSAQYSADNEAQTRAALENNDNDLMRKREDVLIINRKLILQSPDLTLFAVTVANDGTLSATAL